ncbi:uncharacterized protein LOC123223380 [Mangifera indica]|uniref:uncharacterized protein LOC123205060 n=4 Tax=Mangifera indica TaxID=29780 RepID=UPI001CFBB46C|nr:uncharacterized protein LOC123205060 [Mangifera indica]XP_044502475.1 uncharacterized protein LOC123223380 [Mangifera indica]
MITGLRFSKELDMIDYITTDSLNFKNKYFRSDKSVTYKDLSKSFMSKVWGNNDEDAVKMAALYLIHYGLLGADNRKVVSELILQLVDDWDSFNKYPWGTMVWTLTAESMSRAIEKRYEEVMNDHRAYDPKIPVQCYALMGFTVAFQLWIYETLNNLGGFVACKSTDRIPRMLRWKTLERPGWDLVNCLFETSQDVVTPVLIPSIEEKQSDWFKEVMDYMGYTEESDDDRMLIQSSDAIQSSHPTRQSISVHSPARSEWTPPPVTRSEHQSTHRTSMSPRQTTRRSLGVTHAASTSSTGYVRIEEMLRGFMETVEERFRHFEERQTSIETKVSDMQRMFYATPGDEDESAEVIFEVAQDDDVCPPDYNEVATECRPTETPLQPRSNTRRTLRGRIIKKGRALLSPFTDPMRPRRPREGNQQININFDQWFDNADNNDTALTYLHGPCKKLDWWDHICTENNWLTDEHMDNYLVMLRHSYPTDNWTCVDTFWDGWLPRILQDREVADVDDFQWPRLLLDPIEGSCPQLIQQERDMRYVAWAKVDKVYIPINYDCQHWACGEIDLKAWTFTVYDSSTSFISSTDKFINMMARYQHLPAIINATRYWEVRGDNPNLEPFTLMRCTDVPQQGKASGDCGVFTLLMIEYLATGRKFDYTSSDSITLRRMIAAKIFAHGCTC